MIPLSLSASSLAVFTLCPARWQSEYLNKTPSMGNKAASVGTSCHGACEMFVQQCYIEKKMEPSLKLLLDFYQMSYIATFGTADTDTDEYKDGVEMLERWFKRTSFEGFEVLTVEVKKNFEVPFMVDGEKRTVPYNYVMDRMDRFEDGSIRVVDYKTIRVPLNPDQLRRKIQARSYGLAAQIEYPDAPRIMVEFDMFRHESVGVVFTREDNANTWRYLKLEAQRIADTPNTGVPERLNSECQYCPRKARCGTLHKHMNGGGVLGISPEEAVEMKYRAQSQMKGLERLIEEVDQVLLMEAVNRNELEWETPFGTVEIKGSRRRRAQTAAIAEIIGPDLMRKYGGLKMGNIDSLLKGTELTDEQKRAIKTCVSWGPAGDPKPKITPASPIEE
jgi:hypothetical protein